MVVIDELNEVVHLVPFKFKEVVFYPVATFVISVWQFVDWHLPKVFSYELRDLPPVIFVSVLVESVDQIPKRVPQLQGHPFDLGAPGRAGEDPAASDATGYLLAVQRDTGVVVLGFRNGGG